MRVEFIYTDGMDGAVNINDGRGNVIHLSRIQAYQLLNLLEGKFER